MDPARPGHVGAPFRGVVTAQVDVGDEVTAGQSVAAIEAIKMESSIAGTVERVVVATGTAMEPGDLIVGIRPVGLPASPETDVGA